MRMARILEANDESRKLRRIIYFFIDKIIDTFDATDL